MVFDISTNYINEGLLTCDEAYRHIHMLKLQPQRCCHMPASLPRPGVGRGHIRNAIDGSVAAKKSQEGIHISGLTFFCHIIPPPATIMMLHLQLRFPQSISSPMLLSYIDPVVYNAPLNAFRLSPDSGDGCWYTAPPIHRPCHQLYTPTVVYMPHDAGRAPRMLIPLVSHSSMM